MRTDLPFLLPLACEEISPTVRHALGYAGLPCVDVHNNDPVFRQKTRFLLTDNRCSESDETLSTGIVVSSKQLSRSGRLHVIDVQSLANDNAISSMSRAETFLLELKSAIEKGGGLWARVADFPYPYRAAICEATRAERDQLASTLGLPAMWRSETDEINEDDRRYRHYLDGGIIFRPRETVLPTPGYFSDDTSGPGHMPLLWQTNFRDFEKWWRLRQQLQFSLARHPQGFVVRCTGDSKQWRPAIEVWKENHVATLPWVGHDYLWKTGQHVWKKEQHKHPAGLFCLARMSEQSHYSGFEVGLKRTA